jgi:glycerol-3-phosphate acyltransferase PlsX
MSAEQAAGVTVALDVMGAERGPEAVAEGVRVAVAEGVKVRAFGLAADLEPLRAIAGVELVEAPDWIGNHEEPALTVRAKPEASIVLAAADVAEGRSQAVVSAGSTGATMAASTFALKRIQGVRRPALALQLPVPGGDGPPTVLLDGGANTEVRAVDLVQFGFLGAAFSRAVLGVDSPRVGLLSVGEEDKKGTPQVIEAHAALAAAEGIDFIGNVEGRDLLTRRADVIVTDGFTGNVALKTIEGTARAVADAVGAAARSGPVSALGGLLLRPALGGLRKQTNPDTTGGAILLGLRGVAIVGHGSSGPDGIANAIRLGERSVREKAVERTAELLERAGATRGALRDN